MYEFDRSPQARPPEQAHGTPHLPEQALLRCLQGADFNAANDQIWEIYFQRSMALEILASMVFEYQPSSVPGGIVCSTRAALRAAVVRLHEQRGSDALGALIVRIHKNDEGVVRDALTAGECVIEIRGTEYPIPPAGSPHSAPFPLGQLEYYAVSKLADLPSPDILRLHESQNAWVHLAMEQLDPLSLSSHERTSLLTALNSPAVRSIAFECSIIAGVPGLTMLLFPHGPDDERSKYEVPFALEELPDVPTSGASDYFPSFSAGLRDTSISSLPLMVTTRTLIKRIEEHDGEIETELTPSTMTFIGWDDGTLPPQPIDPDEDDISLAAEEIFPFFPEHWDVPILDLCNMRGAVVVRELAELLPEVYKDINSPLLAGMRQEVLEMTTRFIPGLNAIPSQGMILESGSAANYRAWQLCRLQQETMGTGRTALCNSTLAHRSLRLYGLSPHLELPVSDGTFQMRERDLHAALDHRPAMVSLTLGTTQLGHAEFVSDAVLERIRDEKVWLHLDCSYGVNLFLRPDQSPYLSRTKDYLKKLLASGAVCSISCDPHKLCAPYGLAVLFTLGDACSMQNSNSTAPPLSAFSAAAMLRTMQELGEYGLSQAVLRAHQLAVDLAARLHALGTVRLLAPVVSGVVPLACRDEREAGEFWEILREQGLHVSQLRIKSDSQEYYGVRLVISASHAIDPKFSVNSVVELFENLKHGTSQ